MSLVRFAAVIAMFAGAVVPLAQASARHASNFPAQADDEAPEGYLPGLSAARGTLCVKQCPADSLPCDPPSFKVADGRCTTQWR